MAKLSSLYGNDKLVKYYTSWEENDAVYIVMEYCPGNLEQIYK